MTSSDVDEPISLAGADPEWPRLFAAEARVLRAALGRRVTRIEHVGSTAVPGLPAKPIVDILVGVASLDDGWDLVPALEAIGYESFGEIFIPGRLYLRKRGTTAFNVAIAAEGGPFLESQLAVRDYLRAHPHEVQAYAAEKSRAWDAGARLFSSYSRHKGAFVEDLARRALDWSRNRSPR